jgi:hypothetical protein
MQTFRVKALDELTFTSPMHGGFTTCMGTYLNGAWTGTSSILMKKAMIQWGQYRLPSKVLECLEEALGVIALFNHVRLAGKEMVHLIVLPTWASASVSDLADSSMILRSFP